VNRLEWIETLSGASTDPNSGPIDTDAECRPASRLLAVYSVQQPVTG